MSVLASLNVMLGANSAVLRRELKRAGKSTKQFVSESTKSLVGLSKKTAAVGQSIGRGMAVGTASVAAFTYAVDRTYKSIDDLRRQAANVSLPVEQYQAYAFATEAAGLQAENFGDVIKDLNAKITDYARTGGGAMADFFTLTGQKAQEWQQLQPAEQFERFVAEINKMSDSDARFWLDEINDSASQMFGTLVGNKGEFAANVKMAKDLGLVMSSDVVRGVQTAYGEMNTLKAVAGGVWTQTLAASAPAFTYISSGIRQWLSETAQAEGGFANLGKVIALSVVGSVESTIESVGSLLYELQSAYYKLTGEHNGYYISVLRRERQMRDELNKRDAAHASAKEQANKARQALELHQQGQLALTASQVAAYQSQIEQEAIALDLAGTLGNQLIELEQQIQAFEQAEGIEKPFRGALGTVRALKSEIENAKVSLSVEPPTLPTIKPGSLDNKTVASNPYESLIKSAEAYHAKRKLMRENDWTQERAELQLKLDEYKTANEQKLLSDREYLLLKSQAEQEHAAQNQSFLMQLQSQVKQSTSDYQTMWGNTFDRFTQGVGESVANAVMQQQSLSESMKGLLRGILHSTIAALAEMGAKRLALWAIEKLINKTSAAGAGLLLSTQAQAMSLMAGINAFASTAAIPVVGPAAAPAAMTAAMAVTGPMAATIAGLSAGMVGVAHSGIDEIPREGTWLLDKGERVYTNDSVQRLDAMYRAIMAMRQQPQALTLNLSPQGVQPAQSPPSDALNTVLARLASELNAPERQELSIESPSSSLEPSQSSDIVSRLDAIHSALSAKPSTAQGVSVQFNVDAMDTSGFDSWYQSNRNRIIRDVKSALDAPI
jgi:hypothetical protein